MRRADIKIGDSYRTKYGYPTYGSRVRVLEFEVIESRGRNETRVCCEIERFGHDRVRDDRLKIGKQLLLNSRAIEAPWTDGDDKRIDDALDRRRRVEAIRERVKGLDGAVISYSGELRISLDLAERMLNVWESKAGDAERVEVKR